MLAVSGVAAWAAAINWLATGTTTTSHMASRASHTEKRRRAAAEKGIRAS